MLKRTVSLKLFFWVPTIICLGWEIRKFSFCYAFLFKGLCVFEQWRLWCDSVQGFFQQFREKAPGQNWEKVIDLTSKLGEINDTEHNKGSKTYEEWS